MKCMIPEMSEHDWKGYLGKLSSKKMLPLFSSDVISFLNDLSKVILKDKTMRNFPELIAMAYWLRKANIIKIKQRFDQQIADRYVMPRGVVLHFAPSNVDTIFVYSFVLSLLVGNINIIRLSQKQDEQMELLIDLLKRVLQDEKHNSILERIFILSYPHDEKITAELSSYCHARVIWGGDETIRSVRSVPLPPLATELVFADRFSSVALHAEKVLSLEEMRFNQLIHDFHNDAFWFNQLGCSSPRLVFWIGSQGNILKAKERFWLGVKEEIMRLQTKYPSSVNIGRMSTAFYFGAHTYTDAISSAGADIPLRVEINNLNQQVREMHGGGGLFLEMSFERLQDIGGTFLDKDQTLSYFGFSKGELVELVTKITGRGVDRIVPVGQALNFNEVWDGYNLLMYFTREIDIR